MICLSFSSIFSAKWLLVWKNLTLSIATVESVIRISLCWRGYGTFFISQASEMSAPNGTFKVQVVTNKSKCLKET
jgi:hypothetical protein